MLLFSVGNLLNFASFAFAAQSLLSALGTVQFISNILFGRYVNREKVTRRVLLATATVCAGCVLLVVFGNHDSPTLSALDMLELYTK
jgi:predicted MFS family arabinose efflux permease